MKKILAILSIAVFFAAACKKVPALPYYPNGTAVTLAVNKTAVTPTPADSLNNVITFSWSNPNYAGDSAKSKYVLEIDSATRNFAKEKTKVVIGTQTASLTGKELNNIVLSYGFAIGSPYKMDIRVTSSYGNNNEKYTSNVVQVMVTPYNDPSVLTTAQTSVTTALATASTNSNTFSWTASFNGYSGVVNYVIQYDSATKNFVAPKEIPVGASILTKAMTQGEMNETALTSGIPGGTSGKVEYRVKATTALGATSYSNVVMVTIQSYIPILRFYLPGNYQIATGYGSVDWTPETAPEFIRDIRPAVFNDLYYLYIYLPANAEFKITEGPSWDINYGGTGGTLVKNSPDNIKVGAAGVYRISISRANLKYDIRQGRMGFVGDGTGAGWTPANSFPTYAMGAPSTNVFVGITNLTSSEWKMIDSTTFNSGSNTLDETRSYGTKSGSTMQVNGDNFAAVTTPGRYRVIWDGRDVNNIKYDLSPATEMRVAGDGVDEPGVVDWDPPTSPSMTYSGNGVWTISIKLKANKSIKFVGGNAWGAFDYEDNSGQNQALGAVRKIKWDGGPDFKTPAVAGTYTIILNENTQTVTIN